MRPSYPHRARPRALASAERLAEVDEEVAMRAVLQRVTAAQVSVEGTVVGAIDEAGLVILLGVTHTDTDADADKLAAKIWGLRIMRDERSASDLSAPLLVISQFTLYADTHKGRRPSWSAAASGPASEPRYAAFCAALRGLGAVVETGVFGADMRVTLCNDGPVTLCLET